MDTRLLQMLVFIFELEQMHDPPNHALYDGTLERGPQGTDWLWEEGPAVIVWDPPDSWDKLRRSRRTIITVTQQEAPEDPWFSDGAGAAGWTKYPVACKWHQCMKSSQSSRPMYTYTPRPIQPEVLDAVKEMLQEMMAGGRPANVRRPAVALLPRTYLIPKPTPGVPPPPTAPPGHGGGGRRGDGRGNPGSKEASGGPGGRNNPGRGARHDRRWGIQQPAWRPGRGKHMCPSDGSGRGGYRAPSARPVGGPPGTRRVDMRSPSRRTCGAGGTPNTWMGRTSL